jgi:hypothetical protein
LIWINRTAFGGPKKAPGEAAPGAECLVIIYVAPCDGTRRFNNGEAGWSFLMLVAPTYAAGLSRTCHRTLALPLPTNRRWGNFSALVRKATPLGQHIRLVRRFVRF